MYNTYNEDKQYTITEKSSSARVDIYFQGELTSRKYVPYHELEDYCKHIEREGYCRAYDVQEYKNRYVKLRKDYNEAKLMYMHAVKYPLVRKDDN